MIKDVYFLTVHEPQEYPGAPAPVNGVIVHALSLLHPDLPQPGAGRIYRCLTEFPDRSPGCLVPLSTLNYELDDGRLWPEVADWIPVVRALIALARTPGRCESMPLALPPISAALLAVGPFAPVPSGLGIPERSQLLDMLASGLPEAVGEPPLWPGEPHRAARIPRRPALPAPRHLAILTIPIALMILTVLVVRAGALALPNLVAAVPPATPAAALRHAG